MTAIYVPGSLVLAGRDLGYVVRFRRASWGRDGYDLLLPPTDPGQAGGYASWVDAEYCTAPVIGENVCATPVRRCLCNCDCPLIHLSPTRLADLRAYLARLAGRPGSTSQEVLV